MDNKNCSNCKFSERDKNDDLICTNDSSEYLADYVDETHVCEEYERENK